jgi:hypothetical protein
MIEQLIALVSGCIGSAPTDDGYRIDLSDGESRLATATELLAAAKLEHTESIKTERDRRKFAGCPVGAHIIHSDDSSRIQQLGLVMLGQNIPAGLKWKTVGGAFVDMTPALAGQIFAAQAARDTALFAHAETLIATVNAATTLEEAQAVDITVDWPA